MFICGEIQSAHDTRPRKIPGWRVSVSENLSVNKRAYGKYTTEILLRGFLLVFFFEFYIWLSRLLSKKVENNSIRF